MQLSFVPDPTTIQAGGTGTVDVLATVTGTNLVGFGGFDLTLVITQTAQGGSVPTQLQFSNPQADEQLGMMNYIFAGNSTDQIGGMPAGNVGTTNYTSDTYLGGDSTNDSSNRMLSSGTYLLARLDLTTLTGIPAPVGGDSFAISPDLARSDYYTFDANGNIVSPLSRFGLDPTSGIATVNIARSVPEPSSLALLAAGLVPALAFGYRKRRSLGSAS